jgi:short-subunit dehydrogenase
MLKNKTVVISGIGPGLGQELAYGAAEHGANCVLAARSEDKLAEVQEKILKTVGKQLAFLQTLPIKKIVKT